MWKKEELPAPTPTPQPETPTRFEQRSATPTTSSERATIGRSIRIRGDVTGDEDLLIQGRVDGSVDLKQHAITVGREGEVKASIVGRVVIVEGRVEGNISSEEQVILRSSAWVQGDIAAPRVVLEDGARFRGGVDMGDTTDRQAGASASALRQAGRSSGTTPRSGSVDSPIDSAKVATTAPVEVTT
jgi:cytoskeletal protein CcmA (bactofilin family)